LKKTVFLLINLLIIIIMFAGCAGSTVTTTTAAPPKTEPTTVVTTTTAPPTTTVDDGIKRGGTLRIISDMPPAVLGWVPEITGAGSACVTGIYDAFFIILNDGTIEPKLAETWDIAKDYTYIDFHLRKGVKFHDGSAFNAEVAKWNLDLMIAAKRQPYWGSVEVVNENTVRVYITKWINTIMSSFQGMGGTWMSSKEAFDKNGIDYMRQNPVGTGPFKFVKYEIDTKLELVANKDYWDTGHPYLAGINYLFIADQTTRLMEMQAGGGDADGESTVKAMNDLKNMGFVTYAQVNTVWGLVGDTANPDSVWANKDFRLAVEYCLNREAIANALGYGYLHAPYQLAPRGTIFFDDTLAERRFNHNKAVEYLAKSGYKGTPVKLIVPPYGLEKDIVLMLQAYMADIGITVTLEFPEYSKYVTYVGPKGAATWEANAALVKTLPPLSLTNYNDTVMYYFHESVNRMRSWLRTPEFNAAVAAALATPQPDLSLMKAYLKIIYDDCSIIPIYEGIGGFAANPSVKREGGWEVNQALAYFEKIWLDQ
jgi:peptide/nickel transport system substrate-binding protein